MQKMITAMHLLSKTTKVLSSLKKAYFSEGVPTLNMTGKVEVLKLLYSLLQSHKVQEAKMAGFWLFSWPARSLKTAQLLKVVIPVCKYSGFLLPPFCNHAPYTVQGRVLQDVFPLFCWKRWQKTRASLFGHNNETIVPA